MSNKHNIIYLPHGGGPLPLLGDPNHAEMIDMLQTVANQLDKPDAILVVSAHWEESSPTITSTKAPQLIYDYSGFPTQAYEIQYPCPGEPNLAKQVFQALSSSGIEARLDPSRGLDHGAYVPLRLMYPSADIPCIQLSLTYDLDAKTHIQVGKALRDLNYDNLLIIGSGMSFHNMQAFFQSQWPEADAKNLAFERWITSIVSQPSISETDREQGLINWDQAPFARFCHPREEHLLPLHVCYGVAQCHTQEHYSINILGKQSSMFVWRA